MLSRRETKLGRREGGDLTPFHTAARPPESRARLILRAIWRRRLTVVFLTALSLLPAIIYVRLVTPQFTSTSELLVRRTDNTERAAGSQPPAPLSPAELLAQRDVITSTPVIAAALAMPSVQYCAPLRDHSNLIESLKRSLIIDTGNGGLVSVSIMSTDPDDATCIVAAVVQAYSQFLSSLRRNGNADALAALQSERNKDQAELAAKSAELLRFGKDNHVGSTDVAVIAAAGLSSMSEILNQAHVEAVQAKAANDNLNRELEADSKRAERLKWFEESTPASDKANSDDEELIRRELLALKIKLSDLEQKYMPGHPTLVRIQQRIDELNLEHDAAIQRRATSAAQREADVQHAFEQEQQRVLDKTALQAEYARRAQQTADLQTTVDDIEQHITRLDVTDDSGTPTVTVLNPAKASTEPTTPDRQRALLIAAGGGFVVSCLLACWLERGRNRLVQGDNLSLSLPILGELPMLPIDFGPIGRGQQKLATAGPVVGQILSDLRAVIDGAKMRGRGVVVLITSPSRGDGKSTLAGNLAVFLAQSRKRVLLIDANFRAAAQARIFGTGNATGLATLLEAEVSIPITAIHHTGTPSLDLIPTGTPSQNPAELLNSQRFMDLLGDLAEQYDYVLLDSPPTVTYSDSRTISASCDLTILVARSDQLNRRLFQMAKQGLVTVGANLCGVVLNSGLDEERSMEILHGFDADIDPDRPNVENIATRKLGNIFLAAAKAIDLVRTEPTNQRMLRQRSLPNDQSPVTRSTGKVGYNGPPVRSSDRSA